MIEQGTIEWKLLRCGKISASRISDILAKGRGDAPSATRESYMYDLAVERLTGMPTESFTSSAMQWGVDNEPLARAAYEIKTNKFVSQVPFVFHPNIPNSGCSPDGLVDDDLGLIEIKIGRAHV